MDLGALQGGVYLFNPDAFFVYKDTDQTIPVGDDDVLVTWDVADYNYNTCFDLVTNHRFTPNKKGLYHLDINLFWLDATGRMKLYKNGSEWYNTGTAGSLYYNSANPWNWNFNIEFNGTTDYVDVRFDPNHVSVDDPILKGEDGALRACFFSGYPIFLY